MIKEQKLSFEKYLNEINKIATPKSLLIIGDHLKNTLEIAKEKFQEVVALERDFLTAEQLHENQEDLSENIKALLKENKTDDLIMILDTIEKIEKNGTFFQNSKKSESEIFLILVNSNNNDVATTKEMKRKYYGLKNYKLWYFKIGESENLFMKNDFETVLLVLEKENL